jgi:hypothetical protein
VKRSSGREGISRIAFVLIQKFRPRRRRLSSRERAYLLVIGLGEQMTTAGLFRQASVE